MKIKVTHDERVPLRCVFHNIIYHIVWCVFHYGLFLLLFFCVCVPLWCMCSVMLYDVCVGWRACSIVLYYVCVTLWCLVGVFHYIQYIYIVCVCVPLCCILVCVSLSVMLSVFRFVVYFVYSILLYDVCVSLCCLVCVCVPFHCMSCVFPYLVHSACSIMLYGVCFIILYLVYVPPCCMLYVFHYVIWCVPICCMFHDVELTLCVFCYVV